MKAQFYPYTLQFKQTAGTSRGLLKQKKTYFIEVFHEGRKGIGECALFEGLSADDVPHYEDILQWTCQNIPQDFNTLYESLRPYPSIQIGVEQALLNLDNGKDVYFYSDFLEEEKGIPINGLIWMGDLDFMKSQFSQKIQEGYRCIKCKIGTHWEQERNWLRSIREEFSADEVEIRVDANGAFSYEEVSKVLDELADLQIHSIEQPIRAGNTDEMAKLCANTPLPIALDEELIGAFYPTAKRQLLERILPQYIILKPSLVGGFKGTDEWIESCCNLPIQWWITSALESNIGLNAIAQYTAQLHTQIPQGLGTGSLFTNNPKSALYIKNCNLWHSKNNI